MAGVSIESVSSVVGTIYEAAYDQERWLDVVTGLRDLLDSSRACIVRFDHQNVLDAVSTMPDREFCSPAAVAAHLRDPLAAASAVIPVGTIYRRTQITGVEFLGSELWQDWYRPRDMYDGLACNLLSSDGSYWLLDVHRGASQAVFDEATIGLLQRLMPHVLRAGQIGRTFEKTSALAAAFSHLPFGILLVDGHMRAGHMNEAAESMLGLANSPISLRAGHAVVSNPGDALQLERLVRDACATADGALPGIGGTLLIPSNREQAGMTRLVLSVAPFLNARAYGLASERCAVIMIREVTLEISEGFEDHIGNFFDLTKAEAKMATMLVSGYSLKAAAMESSITFKTARTYLERIFRKTGAKQQGHLVALLKSVQPIASGTDDCKALQSETKPTPKQN